MFDDLSDTLREVVPLLLVVVVDLSVTLREDVPLSTIPLSLRAELALVEPSLLRVATLEPVTIRPLASLLTLREVVPTLLLLSDLLFTRESYNPRFVERTDVYVGRTL